MKRQRAERALKSHYTGYTATKVVFLVKQTTTKKTYFYYIYKFAV